MSERLQAFIANALREDVGDGDHTSLACIPPTASRTARLLVKEAGILAGMEIASAIFHAVNPALEFHPILEDGDTVLAGDVAFTVNGPAQSILTAERLVLNVMQRMSGIATQTRNIVNCIAGTTAQVLDTRKTTPGMRFLEKQAVVIGGGVNHRFGLFDMVMIKDNHVDYAGGLVKALETVQAYLKDTGRNLKVEIETRNLEEVQLAVDSGLADRLMLDNFSPAKTQEAVNWIAGRCETESSGGITLETIRDYAECGVDYISVGALTHSVKSLDLSLKAVH